VETRTRPDIVEATPEHSRFLAWVCLTAFRSHLERGFWDFMLGGDEEYKLRYLAELVTTEERHWSHFSTFLIAEVGGRPAAALGGYFDLELGGPTLRFAAEEANRRIGRTDEEAAAGFARASSIMNVVPDHAEGAWIVENVATVPDFRRQGLCEQLIDAMLERGRSRGAAVSDVSVFIGNDGAQRAYEKCGFEAVGEKRDAEFEKVYRTPGTRTLRRGLN
jgi:ribosomal protein S18 acetylase RimI-like enzyme